MQLIDSISINPVAPVSYVGVHNHNSKFIAMQKLEENFASIYWSPPLRFSVFPSPVLISSPFLLSPPSFLLSFLSYLRYFNFRSKLTCWLEFDIKTRTNADEFMAEHLPDKGERMYLLSNLVERDQDLDKGRYKWKLNVEVWSSLRIRHVDPFLPLFRSLFISSICYLFSTVLHPFYCIWLWGLFHRPSSEIRTRFSVFLESRTTCHIVVLRSSSAAVRAITWRERATIASSTVTFPTIDSCFYAETITCTLNNRATLWIALSGSGKRRRSGSLQSLTRKATRSKFIRFYCTKVFHSL